MYRLRGARPEHDIVAKRRRREKLEPERAVYEELLNALPVRPARYHGHVPEAEGDFGWLFMGYVEGEPLRPGDGRHLAALADYLLTLHAGAASSRRIRDLPDRGLRFYHRQAETASALMQIGIENQTIGGRERHVLEAHLDMLEGVRIRWNAIAAGLERMPPTLVHCDLIPSNTKVIGANGDSRVVVFDWEYCGIGCPAPDLAVLAGHPASLVRYADGLRGLDMSYADVRRLADVGVVFRFILALTWDGASLRHPCPHRSLRRLTRYLDPFRSALDRVWVAAGA